jgi:hypothetical protein
MLEHDPEKWETVSSRSHGKAASIGLMIRRAEAVGEDHAQQKEPKPRARRQQATQI